MFFTFNAVSKTELEILFADEKLAEAKKLAETDPENKTALTRAINNYQESQQRLSARIAGLEKNPNTQVLLDKLAAHTAIHERLFAELETRFQAKKELKEKTELTSTSTETGKPLQKIPKIKPYPLEAEESVLPSKNKTEIPASTIQIPTIIPPAQTPAETANPAPKTQEFTIEADDHGFYPSSDITVSKGTHVKITFIVRTINVYYGGLDFRSSEFKTESTKPGNSVTVEFTANSPLIITSYWPLTGVSKANLQIGIK